MCALVQLNCPYVMKTRVLDMERDHSDPRKRDWGGGRCPRRTESDFEREMVFLSQEW